MLLNLAERFGIAVNGDAIFFFVLVILVFHTIIDEVEDEFFHIESVLLLEGEHALVVEKESQRPHRTEVAIELVEDRTHIADGTRGVVGEGIDEYGDTMGAVAFIGHGLVLALVFTHRVFDGTLNIIFGHVLTLCRCDDRTERGIRFGLRTAGFNCHSDLLADLGKCTGHVTPPLHFGGFAVFKCSSHRND